VGKVLLGYVIVLQVGLVAERALDLQYASLFYAVGEVYFSATATATVSAMQHGYHLGKE
jgi:hypothetical protein